MKTIALAMTGASGAQYGLRLLEVLLSNDVRVHFMISKTGLLVVNSETDFSLPSRAGDMRRYLGKKFSARDDQLKVFGKEEWSAPVASGSSAPDAMVVCPCSMATLSALACGASRSLIERAGDVMLKERRPLVVVPRETPVSTIHLDNMLRLSQAGAVLLPANPGFYHRPQSIDELVDFVVARVMDQLSVDTDIVPRWGN